MIEKNKPVPDFSLPNQAGEMVSLSNFSGQKVVLFFYPKDDTPGCTQESKEFSEALESFQRKNTVIIGISKDSVESHQKFCNKHNLKVILLSDTEGTMLNQYGVWQEKNNYGIKKMGIVRTTILLDEVHVVQEIWKSVKVESHVATVLKKVESQQ